MAGYTETELKLQVTDPGIWEELLSAELLAAADQPPVTRVLEAWYYDTADQALQRGRLAYRVRREGEQWVATVKGDGQSAGGLHCRQEWNVAVADAVPDVEPFMTTPVGSRLRQTIGEAELLPLLTTRFQRRIVTISTADGSQVEVAADQGEIIVPETDRREPILEVELELKQGRPAALLRLGAELSRRFPLLPEPKSKFYRGLVLAGLAGREAQEPPRPVSLAGGDSLGACLERLMPELVQQVLAAQGEFLRQPEEPEALHELRIALRRLRSLLSFIQSLLPSEEYDRHKKALCQWGQELGPLREIDVLQTEWREILQQIKPSGKSELEQLLALERRRQAGILQSSLGIGRATPLLLDLWGWLLESPWQHSPQRKMRLDEFVTGRLQQWLKRIIRLEKKLAVTEEFSLHRMRIRGKKLYYGLECFQPILDKRARHLADRLEILQRKLGYLHDAQFSEPFFSGLLGPEASREICRDAGIVIGWQGRKVLRVRRKARKSWEKFHSAARLWLKDKKISRQSV